MGTYSDFNITIEPPMDHDDFAKVFEQVVGSYALEDFRLWEVKWHLNKDLLSLSLRLPDRIIGATRLDEAGNGFFYGYWRNGKGYTAEIPMTAPPVDVTCIGTPGILDPAPTEDDWREAVAKGETTLGFVEWSEAQ